MTLVSLLPKTRAVTTRVSGSKRAQSTELDIVNGLNGSLCNLCALARGPAFNISDNIFATQC